MTVHPERNTRVTRVRALWCTTSARSGGSWPGSVPRASIRTSAHGQPPSILLIPIAGLFCDLGDRPGEADALCCLGVVQQETGDYRAAAASARQALELYRDLGERYGQINTLIDLGDVQRLTGDYTAAAASVQQAQALSDELGGRYQQAWLLNQLGVLYRLTGDYQAAVASHQQALKLMCDAGEPYGEAHMLNGLGELATRTSATGQARDYHSHAPWSSPPDRRAAGRLEEARALEGTGHGHLHDGHHDRAIAFLRQAWPSTSASEPPPPATSTTPWPTKGDRPGTTPPTANTIVAQPRQKVLSGAVQEARHGCKIANQDGGYLRGLPGQPTERAARVGRNT
jgi:hypothetical protein